MIAKLQKKEAISKKKTKKKGKPDPDEKLRRAHRKEIRSVFRNAGFIKVPSVSDKEFQFKGRPGDFDDIFVYENIIVLAEYTLTQTKNISGHLLPKKILFDKILNNKDEFIEFLENNFPTFKNTRDNYYKANQCNLRIVYCSRNEVNEQHKSLVTNINYIDYPILKYFDSITRAIKLSSKYELFKFLNLKKKDIGTHSISVSSQTEIIEGTLLPENYSNFDPGYKVVTFYISPKYLLEKCYVLRQEGWDDRDALYQRMIIINKINKIRKYLNDKERVFINNIVVTLPADTKLLGKDGNNIDVSSMLKTMLVKIQIQDEYNIIGIIDGQHRVFAYHESTDVYEKKIKLLREKQNLLVTGVIYPSGITKTERIKFEANQFLEINSEQTNAKSNLKQAIGLILKPFTVESIALAVIRKLNDNGPLQDKFERHFYDLEKIKTTSIVSYALKPLVNISRSDSLFAVWKESNKNKLKKEDAAMLKKYIDFCFYRVNELFIAVKKKAPNRWTTDKKTKNRVLTTTAINGLLICMRTLIENGVTPSQSMFENKLDGLDNFKFNNYKSSQYGAMSRKLYSEYFE